MEALFFSCQRRVAVERERVFPGRVDADDKIAHYIKHVFFSAKAEKYLSWLADSVCLRSLSKPSSDKADKQH